MRKIAEIFDYNTQYTLQFRLPDDIVVGESGLGLALSQCLTTAEKQDCVLVYMAKAECEDVQRLLADRKKYSEPTGCPARRS